MQSTSVVALSVTLAVVAGVAVHFALRPATPDPIQNGSSDQVERLQAAQVALAERLEQRLDGLEKRLPAVTAHARERDAVAMAAQDAVDEASVRAVVEAVLAERSATSGGREPRSAAEFHSQLTNLESLNADGAEALWAAAHAAGAMEELVERFRAQARANPDHAESQANLGTALLQQLQRAGDPATQARLATQADQAFDAALKADPTHWEARFSKAASLSYWPPVAGRMPEAVSNLETLVEQQEARAPRPEYAGTYLILGNLYQQQGDAEKAKATWSRGLNMFPDNSELKQRVGQ